MRHWFLAVSLACAGCTGAIAPDYDGEGEYVRPDRMGQVPGTVPSGELTEQEQALLDAINEARAAEGLAAVVAEADKLCAARVHSEDIGERRECTHAGADGSSPGDRLVSCGGGGWSGEIVACGQGTPESAVEGWLNSPGHRAILLEPNQVSIGASMSQNYWTALFAQ